jgi:hypothetical protein
MGYRIVRVSKTFAAMALRLGASNDEDSTNTPDDIKVIAVRELGRFHPDLFEFVVWSDSFSECREAENPQLFTVMFNSIGVEEQS